MAIIDRIKYDGPMDNGEWMVYKYPSEEFVLGSQLIVNQSQEALFFKGGKALDLFGPGTHTLSTGNIPILNKLVNIPFGGKTPFTAEIYYVNTTAKLDNKWGTSVPFQVTDPQYQIMMTVRSFGQFGISITDARLFITKIVGAVNGDSTISQSTVRDYFNGLINLKIKEIVSKYIIQKRISLLEITAYLGELSEVCHAEINEEFEACGVDLHNFYIESINFPKEDVESVKKALERKTELAILGEHYYRQRSFDVLDSFADNDATAGLANAGIGLGMGLGAVGAAGQSFAGIANNLNISPGQTMDMQVNTNTCLKCNKANPQGVKFCMDCGNNMSELSECFNCRSAIDPTAKFCGQCGMKQGIKKCTVCGKENDVNSKFCHECGTHL